MTRKLNTSGSFYQNYRSANQSFSEDTFRCAEETVSSLLTTATTSERPGMLLGKVQSGKTRTFISVLALAFDNGFDIAIVLSKNSKALIEQTYKRLRSEFAMFVEDGELDIYDIMSAPKVFGKFELDSKLIFVAKKQDDNLRRLIELFQNHPKMATKRVIIVDDEADSASIGYSKKVTSTKPTKSLLKSAPCARSSRTFHSSKLPPLPIRSISSLRRWKSTMWWNSNPCARPSLNWCQCHWNMLAETLTLARRLEVPRILWKA